MTALPVVSELEVAALTPDQQLALYREALAELDAFYAADPWEWLRREVWTIDEASQEILRWPADLVYTRELMEILSGPERLIAIPKSRRMMVSWEVAAWCIHRIRYATGNVVYWQADNEDKAAAVVDKRCKFIEDHLRAALRREYKPWRTSSGMVGTLEYLATQSRMQGIASGPDKGRSYTPSIVVMDECDFHQRGHETLASWLATLEKRAKIVVISSSNGPGKVLADVCKDAGFIRFN